MRKTMGTYDSAQAKIISLQKVLLLLSKPGVSRIYVKKLSPNDNSKNQPYFGPHLTDISFLPSGNIESSVSKSKKLEIGDRNIKYKAPLKLTWVDAHSNEYPAPHAKLIYYPQYPEVRFSGFLQGSKVNLSRWMAPEKQGRAEGRWLLLGVSDDTTIFAYLATPESALSKELEQAGFAKTTNLFTEIKYQIRFPAPTTTLGILTKPTTTTTPTITPTPTPTTRPVTTPVTTPTTTPVTTPVTTPATTPATTPTIATSSFVSSNIIDTKAALLDEILRIHELKWIPGQILNKDLTSKPYKAQNGGGYTLEAQLGISPNGISEPDYLGWEVKQFSVTKFPRTSAKPTTLMTPEPNGGIYSEKNVIEFVRRFGYSDKSGKPDRLNFGGRHKVNNVNSTTNLTLKLDGFDIETRKLIKADGAILLTNKSGEIAASWSFEKIMNHWKRKHSQAIYIPCMKRTGADGGYEYCYGNNIELGEGTDFEMFLSAMLSGHIYYDPGIKVEGNSTAKPTIKRRSQFRVNHKNINELYKSLAFLDLCIL